MVPTWPCQRTDWVHALFGTVKNRAAFEKDFLLVRLTGQVAIQGLHNAKRGRTTCHPSRSRYSRISGSHLRSVRSWDLCMRNLIFPSGVLQMLCFLGWRGMRGGLKQITRNTLLIINFIYAYVLNFP